MIDDSRTDGYILCERRPNGNFVYLGKAGTLHSTKCFADISVIKSNNLYDLIELQTALNICKFLYTEKQFLTLEIIRLISNDGINFVTDWQHSIVYHFDLLKETIVELSL